MDSRIVPWLACAAIAVVLVWFAIWSGGGTDQPANGGPPASNQPAAGTQVGGQMGLQQALTSVFTQNDPKQCTNAMTRAFLRERFGSYKGTLDRCRRSNTAQSETSADSITVESITPKGNANMAAVMAHGGSLDGSVLTVRVVREGGQWKLDSLTDIQINRANFDQHLKTALGARGYLPAETSCAMAKFDQTVSDADVERNLIIGDADVGIEGDAASCLSRPTLLRVLGEDFEASLEIRGFSGPIVRCVVNRLTHGVPTARLRHLLAAGEQGADGWARLGYEAALECVGGRSGGPPATSRV
jgi:hypothetical protein